jgi:hypothetical protein
MLTAAPICVHVVTQAFVLAAAVLVGMEFK